MEHKITVYEESEKTISVLETFENYIVIRVSENSNQNTIQLDLSKEQLHSFIGTLLHVQQKMKGGK
jgi:hypothetical protein